MIDAQQNVVTIAPQTPLQTAPESSGLLRLGIVGDRDLEAAMLNQQAPLKKLAQWQGIAPDAIDDVVQETLIEAWRHLSQLRSPAHFDAWLQGICRNVCHRWHRSQQTTMLRQTSLSSYLAEKDDGTIDARGGELPLLPEFDPAEILCRQDLVALLDRALGYLPETLRSTVELYYLSELPQREAAVALGLTVKAFEVRLSRARRQLRQLLSTELRAEALTFGLAVEPEVESGWRETREWCTSCGRHRLYGYFERMVDGRICIHFRCPGCKRYCIDNSLVLPGGQSSFRPALKRTLQWAGEYLIEGLQRGVQRCPRCGGQRAGILTGMDESVSTYLPYAFKPGWTFHCPACDETILISLGVLPGLHSDVQRFMLNHPRRVQEPIKLAHYAGESALQFCIRDMASTEHIKLFMHPTTWEVLGVFQN